jgi:hypothetical protein
MWADPLVVARQRRTLVAFAAYALAVGVLVYLVDRGGDVTFLSGHRLPNSVDWLPSWFGGSLPSLLHTLAFSMLLAAVLLPLRHVPVLAPTCWIVIGGGLELLQHETAVAWLARADVSALPIGEPLLHYAAAGTFAFGDLVALAAGAGLSATLIGSVTK